MLRYRVHAESPFGAKVTSLFSTLPEAAEYVQHLADQGPRGWRYWISSI